MLDIHDTEYQSGAPSQLDKTNAQRCEDKKRPHKGEGLVDFLQAKPLRCRCAITRRLDALFSLSRWEGPLAATVKRGQQRTIWIYTILSGDPG